MTQLRSDDIARGAAALLAAGRVDVAEMILDDALGEHPDSPELLHQRASAHGKRGNLLLAAEFAQAAIDLDDGIGAYHETLLDAIPKDTTWQRLAILERGAASHATDQKWIRNLGEAYGALGRHADAAAWLHRARQLGDDPGLAFIEGVAHDKAGDESAAEAAWSEAIQLDSRRKKSLNAGKLGVGVFYQARGEWGAARSAYLTHLDEVGPSPELVLRIGLSYDRANLWADAEHYYHWAVWLDPDRALGWYRLGFSLERQRRWREAADCFRVCVEFPNNRDSNYHAYRAGWCLEKAEEFELACTYYLRSPISEQRAEWSDPSPSVDPASSEYLKNLLRGTGFRTEPTAFPSGKRRRDFLDSRYWSDEGDRFLAAGRSADAAEMYERAVDRSDKFAPELYYKRGKALMQAGLMREAAESFRLTKIYPNPDGLPMASYYGSTPKARNAKYVQFRESLPVRENVILYEVSHGKQIGCNPLAIFEHIVDNPRFSDYLHVWVIENDDVQIPRSLLGRDNVVLATIHKDLYLRYLATAKYLVNNSTFLPYFSRRDGQKYLNTWHGTPLKNMGRRNPSGVMAHTNLARNFLHATHIAVPNEHTANMVLDDCDVRGLYSGTIAVTGSPRIDRMLTQTEAAKADLRSQLGGGEANKFVLYAPTWRESGADVSDDLAIAEETLSTLRQLDCHVLFRGHHFVESSLDLDSLDASVVPRDIDTYDLLGVVDVLVTDYSSILFDFLPTGREIILHSPDIDHYRLVRGFCLDYASMPGTKTATADELAAAVGAAVQRTDDGSQGRYSEAVGSYGKLEDGNASERVAQVFFDDCSEWNLALAAPKKRVLFRSSLIPNGMCVSLHNLLRSLPSDEFQPALVLEQELVERSADRAAEMAKLPPNVRVLGRSGASLFTIEEQRIVNRFNVSKELLSQEQWDIYWRAFEREFRRILGDVQFDASIEFDGYPIWWSAFVSASPQAGRRSIYQHSEMLSEYKMRFPSLKAIFELYGHRFDAIVSVSEQLRDRNRDDLSQFGVPDDLYTFSNNQLDSAKIRKLADEPLEADLEAWLDGVGHLFVAIGRLSVEKNYELLIRAFAEVADDAPDSRLVIVGSGFLDGHLQRVAAEVDVVDRVCFTGHRENPYSILQRADTFVMSSLHEGQPMVLLEAMTLGIPIVSTDIQGIRGMLGDPVNGLLVTADTESMADGLRVALKGEVPKFDFSSERYEARALSQFRAAVLDDGENGAASSKESPARGRTSNGRLGWLGRALGAR